MGTHNIHVCFFGETRKKYGYPSYLKLCKNLFMKVGTRLHKSYSQQQQWQVNICAGQTVIYFTCRGNFGLFLFVNVIRPLILLAQFLYYLRSIDFKWHCQSPTSLYQGSRNWSLPIGPVIFCRISEVAESFLAAFKEFVVTTVKRFPYCNFQMQMLLFFLHNEWHTNIAYTCWT